jgi:hypothetical protein
VSRSEEPTSDDETSWPERRRWIEVCCWMTLALVPFLYLVNGPAVSDDQLAARTLLVLLAMAGAVGLRTYKLICRYRVGH